MIWSQYIAVLTFILVTRVSCPLANRTCFLYIFSNKFKAVPRSSRLGPSPILFWIIRNIFLFASVAIPDKRIMKIYCMCQTESQARKWCITWSYTIMCPMKQFDEILNLYEFWSLNVATKWNLIWFKSGQNLDIRKLGQWHWLSAIWGPLWWVFW